MNNEQPEQQFKPGPAVTSSESPSTASVGGAHNDKNTFKLLFLVLTPIVLILGLIGGVVLGRTVFKEESYSDKLDEALYKEYYGENGEEANANLEDTQIGARDTERRTDINSVATQLEAYYADFGHYPSGSTTVDTCGQDRGGTYSGDCALAVLTTRGLDVEALRQPNGGAQIRIVNSTPTPAVDGHYYYFPAECSNERCEAYTLYADLEINGPDFVRDSLN